jgi:hypothetical protein
MLVAVTLLSSHKQMVAERSMAARFIDYQIALGTDLKQCRRHLRLHPRQPILAMYWLRTSSLLGLGCDFFLSKRYPWTDRYKFKIETHGSIVNTRHSNVYICHTVAGGPKGCSILLGIWYTPIKPGAPLRSDFIKDFGFGHNFLCSNQNYKYPGLPIGY